MLSALGIAAPAHLFVRNSSAARVADTGALAGDRVVVKIVSPRILHKTDVGGVCIVANDREAIVSAIQAMERNLTEQDVAGFTISRFIDYDQALGNELLLGLRWTDDFGPVVTLGPGGIYTEFLSENFKVGRDVAIFSPKSSSAELIERAIQECAVNPKYSISVGNQMDLTIGDFLAYLKNAPDITIFAVYVEGFAPLDGITFLKAAREITASGRTVILYRAGRTLAGAKASSSHTASIAGDYAVTRELCKAAGVIVAETSRV